jgi:hypothetical protein
VESIDRILENAAKLGGRQRREGNSGMSSEGGETSKGQPKGEKKGPEEKKDPLKDNKPGNDKPDNPEKTKSPDEPKGSVPPPSGEKRPPAPRDLKGVFEARLPDKVREAIDNGDFDQIPERYRELVREFTRALAEKEKKEVEAAESGR